MAVVLIAVAALIVLCNEPGVGRTEEPFGQKRERNSDERQGRSRLQISGRPDGSAPSTSRAPSIRSTDSEYMKRWSELSMNLEGLELQRARVALIQESGDRLSSVDFTRFVGEIIAAGEFDNYAMVILGAATPLFSNIRDHSDFRTVANILNDFDEPNARTRFSHLIGAFVPADSFSDILSVIRDSKSKQAFLTGYCGSMVATGAGTPTEAFHLYQSALPTGGDFSGLLAVASSMKGEFEAVLGLVPNDGRSIAQDIRAVVVRRWSEVDHRAAISFILSNPERIESKHLATAVQVWAQSDRQAPTEWAKSLPENDYKDIAINALVDIYRTNSPEKAWKLAMDEASEAVKETTLDRIHAEWIKADPDAAEEARIAYETSIQTNGKTQ
jgi:hypothetical protein